MAETETIGLDAATDLIRRALVASGVAETGARLTAEALVAAEAEGQVGHGFSRLADYAAQVRTGKVRGDAVPKVTRPRPGTILVDAGFGFAYPALDVAIREGVAAADEVGTVAMAISRSHHCGALSIQVEKIAQAGCLGLMVANAPAAIAPWGAREAVFGTNPIAFGVPRPDGPPLVIDLSLSRVARGKVMHAKKSGTSIPEGWALDKDGNPTTDPEAALAGTMVPIGEAKGTALALMVEILSAVFTGANLSINSGSFFTAEGDPPGTGQFLMAIKPADMTGFAARIEALLGHIESLEGARLPGTRRLQARAKSEAEGLNVPVNYLNIARELAGSDG
ncbi:Ldh family oxidoreductase [Alphaproteobacteria bacterium GH1-50]|uniref:Ldh family oxidoreductase n=1 Tax=Kangsaoukella pontilimi TaxID=2691042 RepID=A0A7C9MM02_9RHOB|nr:Ldh family oxidoreductase [Kangsaoukella pontilimi]MXQ09695.1 Ldh family oxidoreductase [Kangsaoukella pontilimi]